MAIGAPGREGIEGALPNMYLSGAEHGSKERPALKAIYLTVAIMIVAVLMLSACGGGNLPFHGDTDTGGGGVAPPPSNGGDDGGTPPAPPIDDGTPPAPPGGEETPLTPPAPPIFN